ncbi:AtpZ/AtpI family protein [Rhodospira trueperi]|uniref:AtpZ/AtpI family protein n=1 Tax=Rhodospira trueperi TaxID=69960 RepID=UPI003CCC138F
MEQRIRAARGPEHTGGKESGDGPARGSGMGLGMRISVEMVVTVAVGAGIGYLLDAWLGTAPLLMIVFLFLGAAAGVSNVYRVVQGLDEGVGLGRAIEAKRRQEAAEAEARTAQTGALSSRERDDDRSGSG